MEIQYGRNIIWYTVFDIYQNIIWYPRIFLKLKQHYVTFRLYTS